MQDSRYDQNFNLLWGRLKRATKILFGKKIYYNDVHLEGTERFNQLVKEMTDLANDDLNDIKEL